MTPWKKSRTRCSSIAGLLTVAYLAGSLSAQDRPRHVGLPDDWSHRHLLFSNPGTHVQMLDRGVSQERWLNWLAVQQEPRFKLQQAKHNRGRVSQGWDSTPAMAPVPDSESMQAEIARFADKAFARAGKATQTTPPTLQRDWNIGLGAAPPVNMYPAKFGFDVNGTPDCVNDYVVFPIGSAAIRPQAVLIAFNNLYVPGLCGAATTPSFKFAYDIGTGVVLTSPVLSLDGTRIAFVESRTSGANAPANFHVLTIGTGPGNGTSIAGVVPGVGNNAVDTFVPMAPGDDVSISSPFVDYAADVAYVGDDAGNLHKFTGVFRGTLAEAGLPWPVNVGAPVTLTGPVAYNGNIFVGGANGNLYCSTTAGASCTIPSIFVGTEALLDAPIVDGSTNQVFVATRTALNPAGAILVQVPTSLASQTTVRMGNAPALGLNIHNGAFDHNYLTGANPSAGFMYFCGVAAQGNQDAPTLYRVGFNASGQVNGTREAGSAFRLTNNANNQDECSPLTEIYNPNTPGGPTDLLFVTIARRGNGCGGLRANCIGSLDITSTFPNTFRQAVPLSGSGSGTSAVVVDNVADVVPTWAAGVPQAFSTLIIDSNGNVQLCTTAGTSKSGSPPTWSALVSGTTTDGTATWTMRGPYKGSWQASHAYSLNDVITDFSANQVTAHLQRVTTAGTSGATPPSFAAGTGVVTTDGTTLRWTNLGPYTPSSVSNVYFADVSAATAYKFTQSELK